MAAETPDIISVFALAAADTEWKMDIFLFPRRLWLYGSSPLQFCLYLID
jgi:hypothetical protein